MRQRGYDTLAREPVLKIVAASFLFLICISGSVFAEPEEGRKTHWVTQEGETLLCFSQAEIVDNAIKTEIAPASTVGLLAPSTAIVWRKGHPWVYVQKKENCFLRTEISLVSDGPSTKPICPQRDCQRVLANPVLKNKMVVQGAAQLLSEEFINEIGEDAE